MNKVFGHPESLTEVPFTYCPGCHHGIAHRLVAEVLEIEHNNLTNNHGKPW